MLTNEQWGGCSKLNWTHEKGGKDVTAPNLILLKVELQILVNCL